VRDTSVGVYVHVPFCERVCPYCDFPVVAARRLEPEREAAYVEALLSELELRRVDFAGLRLASVYLGGGTPALLRAGSVATLVAGVRAAFAGRPAEVTLEVNPSTVERERLAGFRAAGVDRLSIGIQSFDDAVLKRLGRAHRADAGRATLAAAREAGFDNVSLDLIVAVPGQSPDQVEADLEETLRFAPEHVSAYALTVEPGTPYARGVERGVLRLPPEEDGVRMLEALQRRLAAGGLEPYEISSYARPGFESQHNRRYWERRPVLGLGLGAWSVEPRSSGAPHGARRRNLRSLPAYLERVTAGAEAREGETEVLAPATARGEAAFLGLRTRRGLDAARFAEEFGAPPRRFFAAAIARASGAGLLEEGPGGDLRLTPRGRLLSDSVFEAFVEASGTPAD
jgi:oxygen-independent coproporphyrinogen-3 oxidase